MKISKVLIGCGALVASSVGCASSPPPRELLDARAAYQRAETGDAVRQTPAAVHDARLVLDRAERLYRDDEESAKDVAYIAERKAQIAEVQADTLLLEKQERASTERQRAQRSAEAQRTKGELSVTRDQLEREHAARVAADTKAREALDKLAMASALAIKEEPRGTVLTLPGNVLFASGKSELLSGAQARLGQIADALKDENDHKILIEGHTDSRGTESANLELGQRRAQAVQTYLVSRGLEQERVRAVGVGASRPVADNATAEGRATNRRVEIVIEPMEAK